MAINIHTWSDRIKSGLCPQIGCNGFLELKKQEDHVRTYNCSDCGHEVCTNYSLPSIEHVN
jgi:predicted RNA-binding Zn-ribbon protein involved in translation (DUF1610 family)